MSGYRVLITGVGGNIGQGIIKSLRAARRSFYLVGIDMEPLSAGFSLVDSYYITPRTGSPGFEKALAGIIRREEIEAVYVCSPSELVFFSRHREALEKELGISVFVNPGQVITIGSDKLATAAFLKKAGLPYPETVLAGDKEGVDRLINKAGFPLIVKPRKGFSSRNVFLVNSQTEISAAVDLVPDLIVQQYLADDRSEFTAATLSDRRGKVRASIVFHRDLCQGTTYRTELVQKDSLTSQVVKTVECLGAVGSCNLQFRLVGDSVFVFEINPRFSGTCGIRYLYGFNDCEMIFEMFRLGIDIKQPVLNPGVALRYWNEIYLPGTDFQKLRDKSGNHV